MNEDDVFKALADPSRRKLLDMLRQQDGQSLSELEAHLPMTRFGVMKHLKQLEEAGLVTTEKVGREKHHFLNPVPIQMVYDRWVRRYAQPLTTKMTDLKMFLEGKTNQMSDTITHRYQIFIESTAEKVWEALTSSEISPQYYFGTAVISNWNEGDEYTYVYPDKSGNMIEGQVLEIDPPRKLVQTFNALWEPDAKAMGQSKVTWLLEQEPTVCKLTLIHEELKNVPYAQGIIEGWARIMSGMKSLLEKM